MQYVSRQSTVYRYVTETLSYDDEDWYKISLDFDDEIYLDLNAGSGTIVVDLYGDSNFNVPLSTFQFQQYGNTHVYRVTIPSDGLYHLRVYHTTTSICSTYNFTIGNPKYTLGSYTHNFNTTTLAAKAIWQDTIDLTTITSIPDRAIGYQVSIGGGYNFCKFKKIFLY